MKLHTLSLTPHQQQALSRLLLHLRAAWLEDDDEMLSSPFSPEELQALLPLLPQLSAPKKAGHPEGEPADQS